MQLRPAPTRPASNAVRLALRVFLATWILLVATGVYLILFYRPSAALAYQDLETLSSVITVGHVMRLGHRLSGYLAIVASVTLLAAYLVDQHKRSSIAAAVGVVCTVSAGFTGYLLPWDQLALWAVTVGTNMQGFWPIFHEDNVRFVLLGGVEVDVATLRFWFVVHVIVLPLVIAACTWLAQRFVSAGDDNG